MPRSIPDAAEPTGEFTTLDGELYYRISAYHRMPPFLMSIASDTDLWMFVTSGGGLTAGRVDADGSLFPYETADKLYDGHHHTGPITLVRLRQPGGAAVLWQPFSEPFDEEGQIERSLYKNTVGNRVVFEEISRSLGLAFRYRWSGCDELGWVRTATLKNLGSSGVAISLLDGLRNILPHGAPLALHQQSSYLVDGYRRTDCDPDTQMGIFSLTSKIIDRAEAAEELRANSVWCHGLPRFHVCLSIDAVAGFRRGDSSVGERVLKGQRGNYLVSSSFELRPGAQAKWHLAADVGRSHIQLARLRRRILEKRDLGVEIEDSLDRARDNLLRNVGSADGIQLTGHVEASVHHFANVLFNNMRGGVFAKNYDVPTGDLIDFLRIRNRIVADRCRTFFSGVPAEVALNDLLARVEREDDADLERLCHEYLPITFGRRHGDPSRPWNRFEIRLRNPDGTRTLHYEGNWRDIFQNWEALSMSFPGFLPSIIAKFVNASTMDGFNPYRLTRDGVDWEVVDPDDPWSYIGYWGDHQIVYLLKFLEALPRFHPGALEKLLERDIFCYSNVPYRLEQYDEIMEDPYSTITYDAELAARIADRVKAIGTDGKLVLDEDGSVYHVNLLEKLLVPALCKLSNFVPDGGIWMNTQRPEWNDANNALVGRGISMVTLCYLRRYLVYLEELLNGWAVATVAISNEVGEWFQRLRSILAERRALLDPKRLNERDRKRLLDSLGGAFSEYRESVYSSGFSGRTDLPVTEVVEFCHIALEVLDHTISMNRRKDGLYHSYNLMEMSGDEERLSVFPLYEMLEGQVAVLSSGVVKAKDAERLISRLFESRLYRDDQRSFLLYPDRELPAFLDKNAIPEDSIRAVPLLRELVEAGDDSVLARDAEGVCRFHGDFKNARDLGSALDRLPTPWADGVARDRQAVLDLFEEVFHHRSFTGRSGVMYRFEGLGCIYWHMVSKLLLAVQEIVLRAAVEEPPAVFQGLARAYYRIRDGLGFEKTAVEYGAFPTDPYSHTPAQAGAQQPGMTGQVKEEILTRFGELGVRVEKGVVGFRPALLRRDEFLKAPGTYRFFDLGGNRRTIDVPAGALAFSFCQVPVTYELTEEEPWIRVTTGDGRSPTRPGDHLDRDLSRALFDRLGRVARIDVGVPESSLCGV